MEYINVYLNTYINCFFFQAVEKIKEISVKTKKGDMK